MQIIAIVVSLAITAVAVGLAVRAVRSMLGVIRTGQPDATRRDEPGRRLATMFKETLGHTRMLQWTWIGIMHWFVFVGFIFLSSLVFGAYLLIFDAHQAFPVIGTWVVYEWPVELLSWLTLIGIVFLIAVRQKNHPRTLGRRSRFFRSNFWQAYFVEAVILSVVLLGITLRTIEYALLNNASYVADHPEAAEHNGLLHFPTTAWLGELWSGLSLGTLENLVYLLAMVKIVVSMTWLIVIARNITMGVAWHRFTAWFNIFYKRESDGSTALGAMKPLTSAGVPVTLDDIEELDEESTLGVGKVEDFSWKGMLDFTTCTECGRCQSQCPAWNTEKPLSPKLLITAMRDHAYAKAPYVQAVQSHGGEHSEAGAAAGTALLEKDEVLAREAARPLVGDTGDEWFYMPEDGSAVIDPDVLWNCTSCGACVQQCPVDIEHVDHIMDMRRYQVLVESNFPAELNQLFKGLENKGNPWNMSSTARMDWAKGLDFDVPVVGEDLESLESVDWLFWVGCAGAYEDRAKKTTRAVAELLDMAGISFGVLGNGETCTGDPARRAGNEFVFQGLATQNVETFKEYKVKKVVSTCAHCFNTLKNEYKDFGIELEVVHHTQLLNRLVREGRLTPIKDGAGAAKRSITYHDPCYLGRHNQVYSPPRELLQILPGAEFTEMERNSEKSFCCGAGGARMWMEEQGERINLNRTKEAVGTGADQIAVGCPFCRVMLSDGLTAQQAAGEAREEVEVLDVAQMLLASVKGESATKAAPAAAGTAPAAAGATAGAVGGTAAAGTGTDVATKAEPEPGDVTATEETITETADVGPAAKASGGSSLFDLDTSADDSSPTSGDQAAAPAPAAAPKESGSLFDLGGDTATEESTPATGTDSAEAAAAPASKATDTDLGSGGSLFDLGADEAAPAPAASSGSAAPAPGASTARPAETELGAAGSLFDLSADEPPTATSATPASPPTEEPAATTEAPARAAGDGSPAAGAGSAGSATTLGSSGSLFDIAAEPATSTTEPSAPEETPAEAQDVVTTDEAAAPAPGASDAPAQAEAEPETAPVAASGAVSTPATSIPEGGSLFDLEAPAPAAAAAPATPATPTTPAAAPAAAETSEEATAPAAEVSDVPAEPEPTPATDADATDETSGDGPAEGLDGGAALSRAASYAADEDAPGDEADAAQEAEPGPQVTSEPADTDEETMPEIAAEPPADEAPAPSGKAHTPKTDVDISDTGSLFDL